jgi:phospholipid transport system substrate-binding protein
MTLAIPSAYALTTGQAAAFIENVGNQLVSIVNGPGSTEAKSAALARVVNNDVDVDGIAKFCLGRYWRVASDSQRQQYEALFHKVLLITITGKLGDYKGVRFTVGRATPRAEGVVVDTTIATPNKAPAQVDWVVRSVDGRPKIVDVIAEGTSLRLTQRDDYSSFIAEHNQSVQALIDALRKQVSQNA